MPEAVSLQQAYKMIKEFMKEEKWLEAHRACLEILHFDPENIKIIHYKNKIEKKVKKINQKAIKEDIEKLQPLWGEHKYEELLKALKQLEPYLPDYPALKPIIIKARQKYEDQMRSNLEGTYQDEMKRIKDLIHEQKYAEALLVAEKVRIMNMHQSEVIKMLVKIRGEWIDYEIGNSKPLLSAHKYEDLLILYQRLLKIDSKSAKVLKLIEQTKKDYQAYKIEEKKEFIYKSLEQIKTLYQLKKYEKAYEATQEILEIDPTNKIALSFQKRSEIKSQKLINEEVITQMLYNQKKLKEEYKANRKDFLRL